MFIYVILISYEKSNSTYAQLSWCVSEAVGPAQRPIGDCLALLVPWARRWDISSRLLLIVDTILYLCILGSSAMSWRNLSSSNLNLSVLTQLMSLRNLVKSVAQIRLLDFLEGLSWVSVSRVLNHTLYSMSWVVSGFKFARFCIFDIWHICCVIRNNILRIMMCHSFCRSTVAPKHQLYIFICRPLFIQRFGAEILFVFV